MLDPVQIVSNLEEAGDRALLALPRPVVAEAGVVLRIRLRRLAAVDHPQEEPYHDVLLLS